MGPEIFMDDFERTEWSDSHYAVLGRALVIAARFEKNVKTLSALMKARYQFSFHSSDEEINNFFDEISRTSLASHINTLGLNQTAYATIFKHAREARNAIAHELALGMDRNLDTLGKEFLDQLLSDVIRWTAEIAKGDAIICTLISLANKDSLPNRDFIEKYPDRVVKWVSEI